jgi:hypothetical protein
VEKKTGIASCAHELTIFFEKNTSFFDPTLYMYKILKFKFLVMKE